ncbi:hypothetical protein Q764_00155 [Flavobacterium suncheonense GH29-5 = DSM 17707]|uniref:Uncharacterized protein n=1 Tax=Flavobacterium suncheonense GH29-5 = DSM 17707 TaxID=1121899 RepID=A0A0A2MG47_9FLAO|nr:hypothetical protein Q764_00155 [Flavobacterium suncheonense GH29-5 = DSM 17707]
MFFRQTCLGVASLDIQICPVFTGVQSTVISKQLFGFGFWINPVIKTGFLASLTFASLVPMAPALANVNANTGKITFAIVFIIIKFRYDFLIYSFLQVFDLSPATGRYIFKSFCE